MSYAPEGGDYVLLGGSVEGGAEELGVREQGGALMLSVPRLSEGVPSPEVFYPVGRETALRAYRDMPYLDEIELPLDRGMSEARLAGTPGVVKTGGHEYEYEGVTISCREFWTRKAGYIYSFYSATPGAPISVRGLRIGESAIVRDSEADFTLLAAALCSRVYCTKEELACPLRALYTLDPARFAEL